jgi:hypothetical protein
LSLLGINLITVADVVIRYIYQFLSPIINLILYGTGSIINKSTDVITDTTKQGIDIAGDTVQNIGDLLKKAGEQDATRLQLDNSINDSNRRKSEPKPDNSENPIQKPIASAKTNWCLVGEYQGRRGCIEISEHDKCLSGQVFPNQKACLNPTLTNNMDKKK